MKVENEDGMIHDFAVKETINISKKESSIKILVCEFFFNIQINM